MSALIEMRNQHKDSFEKTHGVKLGFMSAFVRVRFVLKLFLYDIYILYVYCVIVLLIILLACTLLLPTGLYRRPAGDPCRQRRDRRLHQRDCLPQLCRCIGRRGFPQRLSRTCAAQHGEDGFCGEFLLFSPYELYYFYGFNGIFPNNFVGLITFCL